MARRVFRIAAWVSLAGAGLMALAALAIAVTGVLALLGRTTYPVEVGAGPFEYRSTLTLPVSAGQAVCQDVDFSAHPDPKECIPFMLHDDPAAGRTAARSQDADVRPTAATLEGDVELAFDGGWSPYVGASVLADTLFAASLSVLLILLWRLLTHASAGDAFAHSSVRLLRGIGVLVIVMTLLHPVSAQLTTLGSFGYWTEQFGSGPILMPAESVELNLGALALGCLVLLLAEVFRHGRDLEAEQRLTV